MPMTDTVGFPVATPLSLPPFDTLVDTLCDTTVVEDTLGEKDLLCVLAVERLPVEEPPDTETVTVPPKELVGLLWEAVSETRSEPVSEEVEEAENMEVGEGRNPVPLTLTLTLLTTLLDTVGVKEGLGVKVGLELTRTVAFVGLNPGL